MKKIVIFLSIVIVGVAFSQTGTGVIRRFINLTDTPSTYSGQGSKVVAVNAGGTAVEFISGGTGDLLADATVPMTANWDIGNYDITLKSLTGDGTITGASLTDGTATLTGGALTGLTTALTVAQGGTGATSLNDGFVLLGSNTAAITPLDVTTDGGIIIGDGTTDPVVLDVGSSTAITVLGTVATGVWQGTAIADAYVDDNITIDLATLATTLTITDNESTAENNPIVFVAGAAQAGGSLGLETDGTTYYTPSTGTITATEFVGGGSGLTLASTDLSDTADLLYETELDDFSELQTQISDKTLVNTADGATWSGVHTFGGATTVIPWKVNTTAAPTVEGQAIWESDTDELTVGDGSASIVIAAKTGVVFAFNLHDPDSGMDDIKMQFPRAVTITKVTAICTAGTNVIGRLYEVDGDSDDGDAVGVESSDWTFTTTETEDTSFNNATFDAGDYIQWDTTSVSGSVTGFALTVEGYEI